MGRGFRETFLKGQQVGDLEIAPVRELAIFLAESRRPRTSFGQFASSATGTGSGDDSYIGSSGDAIKDTIGVPTSTIS